MRPAIVHSCACPHTRALSVESLLFSAVSERLRCTHATTRTDDTATAAKETLTSTFYYGFTKVGCQPFSLAFAHISTSTCIHTNRLPCLTSHNIPKQRSQAPLRRAERRRICCFLRCCSAQPYSRHLRTMLLYGQGYTLPCFCNPLDFKLSFCSRSQLLLLQPALGPVLGRGGSAGLR